MTQTKHFRAILNADLFWRASACLSTEETRYYLTGVYVEPEPKAGGAVMVSTDGHKMIVIRDAAAFVEGDAIVALSASMKASMKALVGFAPTKGKKSRTRAPQGLRTFRTERIAQGSNIKLVIDDNRAALIEFDAERKFEAEEDRAAAFALLSAPDVMVRAMQWAETRIEGTFPQWRRVVPAPKPELASVSTFNQRVIQPVIEALTYYGRAPCARAIPTGAEGSPYIVRTQCREIDGFGIVMPMRADTPDRLPDWMVLPAAATDGQSAKADTPKADEPKAVEPAEAPVVEKKPAVARKATKTRKATTARRVKPVAKKAPVKKAAKTRKPAKRRA